MLDWLNASIWCNEVLDGLELEAIVDMGALGKFCFVDLTTRSYAAWDAFSSARYVDMLCCILGLLSWMGASGGFHNLSSIVGMIFAMGSSKEAFLRWLTNSKVFWSFGRDTKCESTSRSITGSCLRSYRMIHASPCCCCETTVSNKTVPITNPNTVREVHCNHTWEFRLALVWPNKVQTLGYKPVLGSCDLDQRRWRYVHFESPMSLEQFCCCHMEM